MALSNEDRTLAVDYDAAVRSLIDSLDETNDSHDSTKRGELIESIHILLADLNEAVDNDDADSFSAAIDEIDLAREFVEYHHDIATEEWKELYADFLENVLEVRESFWKKLGSASPSLPRNVFMPQYVLRFRWLRLRQGNEDLPEEVKEIYVAAVVGRFELALATYLTRIQVGFDNETLNSDDIPSLLRYTPLFITVADASIRFYYRTRALERKLASAKENLNPSFVRQVWSVAGWSSYSDFLIDVGLFAVTGGGSVVLRFGRKIAKGVKVKRKLGRARRLRKMIKAQEEAMERALEARRKVLRRIQRQGVKVKPDPRATRRLSREVNRRSMRIAERIRKLIQDYVQSANATKDLLEALSSAGGILAKVATSVAAEQTHRGLGELLPGERRDKGVAAKAQSEVLKALISEKLKEHAYFGSDLDDFKDRYKRSLVPGVGDEEMNVGWWFTRLFIRQVAVRYIEKSIRKQQLLGSVPREVGIASVAAAVEELLLAMHLPASLAGKFGEHVSNAVRKTIAGIADRLFVELATHIP